MAPTARKPMSFDVDRSPPTVAELARAAAPTARPNADRQQIGARVTKAAYRQLKAHAALQGVTVQTLVEQAIVEFLARQSDRPASV